MRLDASVKKCVYIKRIQDRWIIGDCHINQCPLTIEIVSRLISFSFLFFFFLIVHSYAINCAYPYLLLQIRSIHSGIHFVKCVCEFHIAKTTTATWI